jgi:hypothetical protein
VPALPRPAPPRPALQAIPPVATAPVLVLVGAMMMGECTHIDWSSMLTAVPAFLTIVIQPFTFSIANGIYAGLVMSLLLFFLTGHFLDYLPGRKGPAEVVHDLEERLLVEGGAAYGHALDHRPPSGTPLQPGSPVRAGSVHATSRDIAAFLHSSLPGSYSPHRGSYERGSFTMYINTRGAGSQRSGSQRSGSRQPSTGTHSAHGSVEGAEH